MNERIKQLAYQADDEVNPFKERYLVDLDPAFIQKFAELIILECISMCDNIPSEMNSLLSTE